MPLERSFASSLNRLSHDLAGVRQEQPQTHPLSLALTAGLSNWYARASGLVVNGSLPEYGAALCLANHVEIPDALRAYYVGMKAVRNSEGDVAPGRLIRGLAKSTLFGISEGSEVRTHTGKTDLINSDNPVVNFVISHTVGAVFRGVGAIPVRRGESDREAFDQTNQALADAQMVAMSLIESRDKSGGLYGLKRGAALILMRNPTVPCYLIGISKKPNVMNIATPITFEQIKAERGPLTAREFTMILADGIMKLLPSSVQERWKIERALEKERLYQKVK